MGIIQAAAWGLAGGGASALLTVAADVVGNKYQWPWRGSRDGIWPRIFVCMVTVIVGALPAAAAHSEMTGPWPAFIMGVCAPSVIRGMLSRVEVVERKPQEIVGGGDCPG
jgi:hypothetical protein